MCYRPPSGFKSHPKWTEKFALAYSVDEAVDGRYEPQDKGGTYPVGSIEHVTFAFVSSGDLVV